MKTRNFLFLTAGILILALGALSLKSDDRNFEISKQLNIYASLFREANLFYVDEVDPGDLVTTSVNAMLKSLDPYTVFYPEANMEDVKLMTTGEYAGIGAVISKKGDHVIIREPYKGFPADKTGLLPGDIILSIDGNSIKGKSTDDVSEMLKGQPGKEITVRVQREGEEKSIDKKAIREKIQLPSVPYYGMAQNHTGYIYLNSFTDKSAAEVRKAALELKNQGATSLILDLRGNTGGLLEQAVEICNFFLPKDKKVVDTRGKVKQWDKEYKTSRNPILPEIPLVVLIDRGSASASEIVAGTLQDYDRAVLIGERSFGKGLVQTIRDLPYNTKMKVTTAKYYIPSGRCIQALDYSHRNPDGSVGKVPDSLITEYTTEAGRKVYDGGGITPDIKIETEELSRITQELILRDLCFDFVNSYALKNPQTAEIKDFKITDDIYNQFKNWLKEKKFTYETESQRLLTNLEKTAKDEKYYEQVKPRLEQLKKDFAHSIDRDMDLFREQIASFLAEQFMQRYYYAEGVMAYKVLHDKEVEKAVGILANKDEFARLLK
ncbi:MAG: S41 family peptidase [Odoribacter sp.]|nr:S41 family peptidase [Odoribacter sp.]